MHYTFRKAILKSVQSPGYTNKSHLNAWETSEPMLPIHSCKFEA